MAQWSSYFCIDGICDVCTLDGGGRTDPEAFVVKMSGGDGILEPRTLEGG